MAFKIEESFEVQAPIGQVWEFLIDPRRVVVCLPGAELTDVIDERTYAGRVRVKVGPVTAAYKGTVRLEEVTEANHLMRLAGEGKETAGSGSAKMVMTGRLSAAGGGATHVNMEAEIEIAGKMARFGRGVMEDVSRQLFRQFATSMQEALAQPVTVRGASSPAEPIAPPEGRMTSENGSSPSASPSAEGGVPSAGAPPGGTVRGDTRLPPTASRPVGVLRLVGRAVWSRVKRLFGI